MPPSSTLSEALQRVLDAEERSVDPERLRRRIQEFHKLVTGDTSSSLPIESSTPSPQPKEQEKK